MDNTKGMTLVEVVVTLAILVASIGIFTMLFIRSWDTHQFAFSVAEMQLEATEAIQGMIDTVRNAKQADSGAFPLSVVEGDELVFYADIDSDDDVERVRYRLSGGVITREIRNPSDTVPPTYSSGYEESSEILAYVRNSGGDPLFRYYNNTNSELTGSFSVNEVTMVQISLRFDKDENTPPDVLEIESFASIRNLNQYDQAD